MGFDAVELPLEQPGDLDPERDRDGARATPA